MGDGSTGLRDLNHFTTLINLCNLCNPWHSWNFRVLINLRIL